MYRVKAVAARLGVSERHVWRLIKGGKLAHYKMGRRVVVSDEQLAAYLQSVEVPSHGV